MALYQKRKEVDHRCDSIQCITSAVPFSHFPSQHKHLVDIDSLLYQEPLDHRHPLHLKGDPPWDKLIVMLTPTRTVRGVSRTACPDITYIVIFSLFRKQAGQSTQVRS
jgi:hypothetical protein